MNTSASNPTLVNVCFLGLWNDFDPERMEEYDVWHTFEHVPERLSVPGMVQCTRYRALAHTLENGGPTFFTLYALTSFTVLQSAPYRAIVNEPTRWTTRMRPSFRQFERAPSVGWRAALPGQGGFIATQKFDGTLDAPRVQALSHAFWAAPETLGATALQIGQIQHDAHFPIARSQPNSPPWVVFIECVQKAKLHQATEQFDTLAANAGLSSSGEAWRHYRLDYTVTRDSLYAPDSQARPSPREDLHKRYLA